MTSLRTCSGAFTSCSPRSVSCSSRSTSGIRLGIPWCSSLPRLGAAARSEHESSLVSTSAVGGQVEAVATKLGDALKALNDAQRQRLAQEWGYTQLGAPLPKGVTPSVLARSIPDDHSRFDAKRLILGLAIPLGLMAAGYAWMWYMHSIIPGWQQAACWLLVGTGYFGIFTLGHEAARLALLPGNTGLQTAIGSVLMAPSLYSLEAWRVGVMVHYNQVSHRHSEPVLPLLVSPWQHQHTHAVTLASRRRTCAVRTALRGSRSPNAAWQPWGRRRARGRVWPARRRSSFWALSFTGCRRGAAST